MSEDNDPRVTGEHVRELSGADGALTLVGVVHDHPASVHRVRRLVESQTPDALAVELPPIAVPLFEQYAQSDREPPVFGGEMSAAIQAADTDAVVGIDRPARGFLRRLVRNLRRERPSVGTVRNVVSETVSASKHALVCRVASLVVEHTSMRVEVDAPVAHDTDRRDPPSEQAADERRQLRKSRALMNAFGSDTAIRASQLGDATREEGMAQRLRELDASGDVVAVVGIAHLDALAERLGGTASPRAAD